MKPVILCGGSGTRLWPISRTKTPKQFAQIFEGQSLFEKTVERNSKMAEKFLIVVNQAQLELCKSQMKDKNALFLAESVGKNTAPAIALAALLSDPEDLLLVLPSDHLIKDLDIYEECVQSAKSLAEQEHLVTFGIKAQYPETGYGYIEADGNDVKSFKEKPDRTLAIQYVSSGKYFWNSGMFCFKAKVYLSELKKHSPEIFQACSKAASELKASGDSNQFELSEKIMAQIPAESVDYAVMEKSDNVKVVPSPFYWSDLGSFDSLYDELDKDESGNTICPAHYQINSNNNLVLSENSETKKVIATFDVSDLIIVDTKDALLIGKKGKAQQVKELMGTIIKERPDLAE